MATAADKDDVLVGKVFNFLCDYGLVKFREMLKKPSPLATRFTPHELVVWIKKHLSTDPRFAVKEARGKIISVKIVSKVRLCCHYVEKGRCRSKGECKFWHVCKAYVEGNCEKMCTRGMSHDFGDTENGDKTEQLGSGRKLQSGTVRRIVAFNLPQVCSTFLRDSCNEASCPFLHLCAGFVNKTCFGSDECYQSHNLRSRHNRSILWKHGFKPSSRESDILCNILLPKNAVVPNIPTRNSTVPAENVSKVPADPVTQQVDHSETVGEEREIKKKQERKASKETEFSGPQRSPKASEEFGAMGQSNDAEKKNDKKPGQHFCQPQSELVKNSHTVSFASSGEEVAYKKQPAFQKTMVSSDQRIPTSSSIGSKMEPVEISEKRVFECICKEYDCSVKFSDISGRADLFPNGKADAEAWFRKDARKNSFIVTEGDNKEILEITAFSSRLRLCPSGRNCSQDGCSFFHVCKDFIAECCTSGATCTDKHEFQNDKDRQLLSSLKILNSFTEEQLGRIFRASTPHVCLDYNAGKCKKGEKCNMVHICKDVLRKHCLTCCRLGHDNAYETPHTKALAEKFRMSVLTLKRVIVVPQPLQGQLADPGHIHQDGAVYICSDFILGQCKNGATCAKHHCPMPYQWQYRNQAINPTWISFNEQDNHSLEFDYSYIPYFDDGVKLTSYVATPFRKDGRVQVTLEINNMTMVWPKASNYPLEMRRLSTESFVLNPDNPLATIWTWYWQDEEGCWMKYGEQSENETGVQHGIEKAFLDPSNSCCNYFTSKRSYVLYFRDKAKGLYQKNLIYGTERKIRRRPPIPNKEQLKKKGNQQAQIPPQPSSSDKQSILSAHWSGTSQGNKVFERVELSPVSKECIKVKKRFRKTMPEGDTIIIKVERVQNSYMWEKFVRKKENMKTKLYGCRLEKELFHGTDPDDVEKICKQNFDWRLYGKNASVFGQGSFFALNASYSDRYSRKAGRNSSHFMFLANVLVGSYAKGDSNMRRPPPRNPSDPTSDLYDSCVDDGYKPRIFVVFEMDQCYPSYVIEYMDISQDDMTPSTRKLPPQASTSRNSPSSGISAAGARAASVLTSSSTMQTRSSVGISHGSSFGQQSAQSYGRTAVPLSSSTSTVQASRNQSSNSSQSPKPNHYSPRPLRAATSSSLAGASSVSSSRAAAHGSTSTRSSPSQASTSSSTSQITGKTKLAEKPGTPSRKKNSCVIS